MAAGAGRSPPPQPFGFFPNQRGASYLDPAAVTISEPRTAFGSPNSPLGCHLVLSAERRGASQGLGATGEGDLLRSSSRNRSHPPGFKLLAYSRFHFP